MPGGSRRCLARRVGRVEAGALARHEADYVAVVPVREAHKLPPLLGDRHAAGAQFRDQPLPFPQHDLAFGTKLCAERKRDVDVEARDLAGIVDSWSPSETSRRPKPRNATTSCWSSQPWRRDSNKMASANQARFNPPTGPH